MKKIIFMLLVLLLSSSLFSQQAWYLQNTNTTQNVNDIFFLSTNIGYAACNGSLLLKTINGGLNWLPITGPFVGDLKRVIFFDQNIGIVVAKKNICRTTNSGLSWEVVYTLYAEVGECAIADNNSAYASISNICVTHSENQGASWGLVYPIGAFVSSMSFLNNTTGYAASYSYWSNYSYHSVYRTTNTGNQWTSIFSYTSQFGYGRTGDVLFVNYDTGYFSVRNEYGNRICRYISGSWYPFTIDNFEYGLFFRNGKTGWSAGEMGIVYKTTNAGINWNSCITPVTTTLYDVQFLNDQTGWVCGDNGVIMKSTNGGYTYVENENHQVPEYYSLFQNYPNPFNPSTTIKFSIPLRGFAKLVIYDINGRIIATPVNNDLNAGNYDIFFDASKLSSGIYFYKLESGSFVETKKMVLIK
jgi:photosystem II stability/assembly factor-like uncharacterized protein